MTLKLIGTLLLGAGALLAAESGSRAVPQVPLWPQPSGSGAEVVKAPASPQESTKVSSIHNPSILVYLPPKGKSTGAAMIIAPGGGHRFLSIDTEGTNVAEWLNTVGVTAFVLKYRLAKEEGSTYKVEDAVADAQQAVRIVRTRAAEWGVNPSKVGIMGFSAGGEVAALASAQPTDRPDYQILIYPGIRAENINVTKDSPPAFMLCADNDRGPSTAIPSLYLAFKKAGVPAELHIYASGGHGFGLRTNPAKPNVIYSSWYLRLQDWMADVGMSPRL